MNKYELSLASKQKMDNASHICKTYNIPEGDVIEIGVWKGGFGLHLLELFPDKQIHLVDTFEGIPFHSEKDNHHQIGDFRDADFETTKNLFKPYINVQVYKGIFPNDFKDTFEKHTFSIVHLDVDVYDSYKLGLEYLYDKISEGGIILLDDYAFWSCEGATKAVDEFLNDKIEIVEFFGDQHFIIKGKDGNTKKI